MKEIKRGEIYYANLQPVLIIENAKSGEYNEWFDKHYKAIADEIAELKEKQLEARRRKKLNEEW